MAIPLIVGTAVKSAVGSAASVISAGAGGGTSRPFKINMTTNYKQINKRLSLIQRKQLPFAFSNALNDVAFAVRKRIVDRTYPRSFSVRDKRFASASFRVAKANKRKLEACVFDKLERANLRLHAKGGIKHGRGNIAIPSSYVKQRRSGKGVPKRLKPRTVVDTPKGRISKQGGSKLIFQSYGPKGSKQRLLYSLKPSANIKKSFPFYEDAQRTINNSFEKLFNRQLKRALRTARR